MRCPDCQKFVSFDTDTDPEVDLSVDDEGVVSGTARIVNACGECSQELTEANLDVEFDLSGEVADHREKMQEEHEAAQASKPETEREPYDEAAHDTLDVDVSGYSRNDRRQTHDRHGKPIKSARYSRQYYGVEISATVTCKCGETFEVTDTTETQASGMESLV